MAFRNELRQIQEAVRGGWYELPLPIDAGIRAPHSTITNIQAINPLTEEGRAYTQFIKAARDYKMAYDRIGSPDEYNLEEIFEDVDENRAFVAVFFEMSRLYGKYLDTLFHLERVQGKEGTPIHENTIHILETFLESYRIAYETHILEMGEFRDNISHDRREEIMRQIAVLDERIQNLLQERAQMSLLGGRRRRRRTRRRR